MKWMENFWFNISNFVIKKAKDPCYKLMTVLNMKFSYSLEKITKINFT